MVDSQFRRLAFLTLVFVIAGFLWGDEAPSPGFRNPKAKGATVKYERSLAEARSEYDRHIEASRKEYIAALNAALEEVTKSGNLDEAVKIRDTRDTVLAASQANDNERVGGRLQVLSAVYGVNQSWFDVTDKLQKAVEGKDQWSTVVAAKDWGDPAPGFGKTLIVRFALKEKVHLKAGYDGRNFSMP